VALERLQIFRPAFGSEGNDVFPTFFPITVAACHDQIMKVVSATCMPWNHMIAIALLGKRLSLKPLFAMKTVASKVLECDP
jgi:hypothetical protein